MVQTEVDLARQLAHATDHTDRAHLATALAQSRDLRNHIFNEPAPTQPPASDDTRPVDTAALLASYDAMNRPLTFTDNAYATSSGRADTADTSPARQFPAAWRPWGAGGDLDTSDVDDDAVLSAMHAAGALEHSPTPTQPPTPTAPLIGTCGHPITGFRDELSAVEYRVSGFCQACQDGVFEPAVVVDRDVATQLADSSDPSVRSVFSTALASAPADEPTDHAGMMSRPDAAEWLQAIADRTRPQPVHRAALVVRLPAPRPLHPAPRPASGPDQRGRRSIRNRRRRTTGSNHCRRRCRLRRVARSRPSHHRRARRGRTPSHDSRRR